MLLILTIIAQEIFYSLQTITDEYLKMGGGQQWNPSALYPPKFKITLTSAFVYPNVAQ